MKFHGGLLLLALTGLGSHAKLGLAAEQASVSTWGDDAERFRDLEVFGVVAHRSLDTDCDDVVALVDLASVQGLSPEEPRAEARLRTFDPNEDGHVAPAEIAAGIRAGALEQVDITMLTDANEDGELSLEEHALGFPDHEGEPDANGFTPRQIQGFEFLDEDGSGRVTREEVTVRHEATFLFIFWARIVSHHMERIDTDGDGLLRIDEFAKGFGYDSVTELPSEQSGWYDIVAARHRGERAISLQVFRIQLLQDRPVSSRLSMERPILSLLFPACEPAGNIGDPP